MASVEAGACRRRGNRFEYCTDTHCVPRPHATQGKRFVLPNTSVMVHQPSGGTQGTASDIAIVAEEIIKTRKRLIDIYDEHTGLGTEVLGTLLERDRYMDAQEAIEHGIVDEVVSKRREDDIK